MKIKEESELDPTLNDQIPSNDKDLFVKIIATLNDNGLGIEGEEEQKIDYFVSNFILL